MDIFSFCLYNILLVIFCKTELNFDLEDKLSPVYNMASSGLKKMLDFIILYTHKSVSETLLNNFYVYIQLYTHKSVSETHLIHFYVYIKL